MGQVEFPSAARTHAFHYKAGFTCSIVEGIEEQPALLSVIIHTSITKGRAIRELEVVRKAIGELDLLESTESCKEFGKLTHEGVSNVSNDTITLHDPAVVGTKGRP
ncbi:hypothetical protein VNO78_30450 [Psophocarpus tetragonolobus]|uniref:Uncharacterized protein n=1 Tax=Psophocarpus tetragonolobus TaxID=3891 RepID=A0AAN9X706_PSOTE